MYGSKGLIAGTDVSQKLVKEIKKEKRIKSSFSLVEF